MARVFTTPQGTMPPMEHLSLSLSGRHDTDFISPEGWPWSGTTVVDGVDVLACCDAIPETAAPFHMLSWLSPRQAPSSPLATYFTFF